MYADNYENRKEKGIMEILTPLEQAVYDYISRTIEKLGYAPSVRDIKAAVGIKSTSTVHSYLERLERKGYIEKEQGKSRTIRTRDKQEEPTARKIPILGQVAAGTPILCRFLPDRDDARRRAFCPAYQGRKHDRGRHHERRLRYRQQNKLCRKR